MADYVIDLFVDATYIADQYVNDPYVEASYVTAEVNGEATISSAHTLSASGITQKLGDVAISSSHSVSVTGEETPEAGATTITSSHTFTVDAVKNIFAEATITSAHSVTADGLDQDFGEVTIISSNDNLSWDEMGTWYEPIQEQWRGGFFVEGIVQKIASSTISSTHSVSGNGVRLRFGDTTIDSVHTTAIDADITAVGATIVSSAGELLVSGKRIRTGDVDIIQSVFTTAQEGDVTLSAGDITIQSTHTVSSTGLRKTFGDTNISSAHTINVSAVKNVFGAIEIIQSVFNSTGRCCRTIWQC